MQTPSSGDLYTYVSNGYFSFNLSLFGPSETLYFRRFLESKLGHFLANYYYIEIKQGTGVQLSKNTKGSDFTIVFLNYRFSNLLHCCPTSWKPTVAPRVPTRPPDTFSSKSDSSTASPGSLQGVSWPKPGVSISGHKTWQGSISQRIFWPPLIRTIRVKTRKKAMFLHQRR